MRDKSNRFPPEVRERAVRIVPERWGEYLSVWAAIESIAPKISGVARIYGGTNEIMKEVIARSMGLSNRA